MTLLRHTYSTRRCVTSCKQSEMKKQSDDAKAMTVMTEII